MCKTFCVHCEHGNQHGRQAVAVNRSKLPVHEQFPSYPPQLTTYHRLLFRVLIAHRLEVAHPYTCRVEEVLFNPSGKVYKFRDTEFLEEITEFMEATAVIPDIVKKLRFLKIGI